MSILDQEEELMCVVAGADLGRRGNDDEPMDPAVNTSNALKQSSQETTGDRVRPRAARVAPASDARADCRGLYGGEEQPDRTERDGLLGADDAARAAGAGRAAGPALVGLEPVYENFPPPAAAQMLDIEYVYESTFMERIVRTWPQAPVTALSKKARAEGQTCSGARPGLHSGINVEVKTWALRIAVAMRFANFVGRTVCISVRGPRPSDVALDRGVAKYIACLNHTARVVINCFLDARRKALTVARGGTVVMKRTLEGYLAAVGSLFTNARKNGVSGETLVADSEGACSPWQRKGYMEKKQDKANVRADPGNYIGNPIEAEIIKDHKGAAEKAARRAGQHNRTSADCRPELLSSLYNVLVRSHIPSPPVAPSLSVASAERRAYS